jgi:hypothetical protein
MPIPDAIQTLIDRLNQKLDEIEKEVTEGLKILRILMSGFPENVILIQYFAYLNAIIFFIETARKQIRTATETISPDDVKAEIVQEAGEDLGNLLGRVIEEAVRISQILDFLEELL